MVPYFSSGMKWVDSALVDADALRAALTLDNPKFQQAKDMGFTTTDIAPTQRHYIEGEGGLLGVPRSFLLDPFFRFEAHPVPKLLRKEVEGEPVAMTFKGSLRPEQEEPASTLASTKEGILCLPCGFGKTVVALAAAARVGVPTLVLVHKTFLIQQWKERIEAFLGIPQDQVGVIGAGQCDWEGKAIVMGMIQSLTGEDSGKYPFEMYTRFGLVISDEVHRLGAPVWERAIRHFPAARRWGLTATPTRRDGMSKVFMWHLGPVVYTATEQKLTPQVYQVRSGFRVAMHLVVNRWNNQLNLGKLISLLAVDEQRNALILKHLFAALDSGRKVLVLSDRLGQLGWLKPRVKAKGFDVQEFQGSTPEEERMRAGEADCILATSQMAAEALDIPELDTLFLTSPKGNESFVRQAVGRILREVPGKRVPVVVDFYEPWVGVLTAMAAKRYQVYKTSGFRVETPIPAKGELTSAGTDHED